MTPSKQRSPQLVWMLMNDMERAVWATAFVLGENAGLDGEQSADSAVERLRSLNGVGRSTRPEPEYEAAHAGFHIEWIDFDVWYRIELLIRHGNEPCFHLPTDYESAEAYERFQRGRGDFY
jgi:hypothetical protein